MSALSISEAQYTAYIGDEVDASFFGANIEAHKDDFDGFLDQKIEDLQITSLRYPGGTWGEVYFSLTNPNESFETHGGDWMGITEFLNYCASEGVDPVITLPTKMYVGDIEQLREDVTDFLTKLYAGEYGPIDGLKIELGNEYNVEGDREVINGRLALRITAEQYAEIAGEMARISNEIDPDINVALQAGVKPEHNDIIIDHFLSYGLDEFVDTIVVHEYPWRFDVIERRMGYVLDDVRRIEDAFGRDMEIYLSEINIKSMSPQAYEDSRGEPFDPELFDWGLRGASALAELLFEALEAGVERTAVWAIEQGTRTDLGGRGGQQGLTIFGEAYRMVSSSIVGLREIELSHDVPDLHARAFSDSDKLVLFMTYRRELSGGNVEVPIDISEIAGRFSWVKIEVLSTTSPVDAHNGQPMLVRVGSDITNLDEALEDLIIFETGYEFIKIEFLTEEAAEQDPDLWGWIGDDTMIGGNTDDSISGYDGNDTLVGKRGNDYILGGGGEDRLRGGGGDDQLFGGEGNDIVRGGAMSDTVHGGAGMDDLGGGGGADRVLGGTGNDTIRGHGGDDLLEGGDGDDWIAGGRGNDSIFGNSGNDTAIGGGGEDEILGGSGDDWLVGDSIRDVVDRNARADTLSGQRGSDYLVGDTAGSLRGDAVGGNDTLADWNGNDTLIGDADGDIADHASGGDDRLDGGIADDRIFGDALGSLADSGEGGDDFIIGNEGHDLMVGDVGGNMTDFSIGGNDDLSGWSGNDTMIGDAVGSMSGVSRGGNDELHGHQGNDLLVGDTSGDMTEAAIGGDDYLRGWHDNDVLIGDTQGSLLDSAVGGADTLVGNSGDDTLYGDSFALDNGNGGADLLYGGEGADILIGGSGNDQLFGGQGADIFVFRSGDGVDTIYDFRDGVDLIELPTAAVNASGFSVVDGPDGEAIICYGEGDCIVVVGAAGQVDETDFILT